MSAAEVQAPITIGDYHAEGWSLSLSELRRRPLEYATAIDWSDTKRVDDAVSATLITEPDDPDTFHEVKVHIADTGLLLDTPEIWRQAINSGFTRLTTEEEPRTSLLTIRLFDILGINAAHNDTNGTLLGAPAITLRYLCDENGRVSQFDMYKSRVIADICSGDEFDNRLQEDERHATELAIVASSLGKRIRPSEGLPANGKSHEILARIIQQAGRLLASSMSEAAIPWIYRANPEGNRSRIVDLDAEEMEQTVVDLLTAMGAAQYTTEPLKHLTLGYSEYTHISSPLRRRGDFILSLMLHALFTGKSFPFNEEELSAHAHKLNEEALEKIRIRLERARNEVQEPKNS